MNIPVILMEYVAIKLLFYIRCGDTTSDLGILLEGGLNSGNGRSDVELLYTDPTISTTGRFILIIWDYTLKYPNTHGFLKQPLMLKNGNCEMRLPLNNQCMY